MSLEIKSCSNVMHLHVICPFIWFYLLTFNTCLSALRLLGHCNWSDKEVLERFK